MTVPRLPDTAEVVRHRVSEEDEHVRRYMVLEHLAGSSGISLEL